MATPNPYQSPSAHIESSESGGSMLRGVLAGAGILLVGWALLSGIGWAFISFVVMTGPANGPARTWLIPYYGLVMFCVNMVVDFAAGFVCARIARQSNYIAPATLALLALAISFGFLAFMAGMRLTGMGLWPGLIAMGQKLIGVVAIFAGAWFAMTQTNRT